MTKYTPEQFKRLPKWAQDHITWQTREMTRLNDSVENLLGVDASAIEVDPYRESAGLSPVPCKQTFLPERITVRYALLGGTIDVSLRKGRLDINATRYDQHPLEIQPSASNSFTVGFGETKA